jgi:DNA ligase-1
VAYSRKLEPLRSRQLQQYFTSIPFLDGEAIAGEPTDPAVYNKTQSHVMAFDKPSPLLAFYVFDYCHPEWLNRPFEERYAEAARLAEGVPGIYMVPQKRVTTATEMMEAHSEFIEDGYEGSISKSASGRYKPGRSTWLENISYKLKNEEDAEAPLYRLVERVINNNEQERDALGAAKRSKASENLVPAGTVGKFKLGTSAEDEFSCAPGMFTHEQLQDIWDNWPRDKGRLIKYRHFPHGAKDKYRQARALGFRSKMDL